MSATVMRLATRTISNVAKPNQPKKSKTPQKSKFTPPSVEEVTAFCQERGNSVNPNAFVDFYTSVGWKVGNKAMKDWRAAVRTWERRPQQVGARTASDAIASRQQKMRRQAAKRAQEAAEALEGEETRKAMDRELKQARRENP